MLQAITTKPNDVKSFVLLLPREWSWICDAREGTGTKGKTKRKDQFTQRDEDFFTRQLFLIYLDDLTLVVVCHTLTRKNTLVKNNSSKENRSIYVCSILCLGDFICTNTRIYFSTLNKSEDFLFRIAK